MFIEKKRAGVSPRALTSDGSAYGLIHVLDARGFFVKQKVYLKSNTQQGLLVEIKRFNSLNSFYVGPLPPGKIGDRTDVSHFTVADGATIEASEQDRPGVPKDDRDRAVYVEEPIVANRNILVDETGSYYNKENTIPVSTGLVKESFDYFSGNHSSTASIYTYKKGGAAGQVVATVTIVYSDSTKREIVDLLVT